MILLTGDPSDTVPLRMNGRDLLTLYRNKDGLEVSASVFSADGRVIAQIERNRFFVNPNNYF